MKRGTKVATWIGAALIAATSVACSDRAERNAEEAADEAGNAAQKAASATAEAAKDATSAVSGAVVNGGRAADAAVETMDVKTALMADSRVDASAINVDSDHATKTVTLKGRVPTAGQKTVAEEIAVAKAVGYRVRNELTIGN